MELEELQSLWKANDEKLNRTLRLNMQLLREVNLNKAGKKLRALLFFKIIEMAILLFMALYLWDFSITYISTPGFCIPSIALAAFLTAGVISDIRQLAMIVQIQSGNAAPVSQLQKKIERLKLLIVTYTRMSFITLPFYPLIMIVGAKIFFHIDCWVPQHRMFLMANFLTGLLLFPLFIWLYRQLSKPNDPRAWVNDFRACSGLNRALMAQQFLNEIEAFEKEDDQSAALATQEKS